MYDKCVLVLLYLAISIIDIITQVGKVGCKKIVGQSKQY